MKRKFFFMFFNVLLICMGVLATSSLLYAQTEIKVNADETTNQIKHYPKFNIHEYTLKNGLKVIVKEDRRAPVAVSQIWYKVGSSNEVNGDTGLSHVLEHMMFKGTNAYPSGEFSKIIAANGGRENAFTGRDYTAYFQQLEKSRLDVSFELEADRMRGVLLEAEEFAKEIRVVMEERRMRTDDNPQALMYEQFSAVAYLNSPYHAPVIGWMNDLEHMQAEDLRVWYDRWYQPNNATLVVVGDVNHQDIFKVVEKYFGVIEMGSVPAVKPRKEIVQKGERRIVVKAPAQVPYLLMGYKFPSVLDAEEAWEPYAAEVLLGILDGGASARFAKHIIREDQVAASVGAGYDSYTPQQELFLFDGTPASGHNVKQLEEAIKEQIDKIKTELVTEKELDRVKAQVVAGKVYERDSIFYQAMQIGKLETIGLGWQLGEKYVGHINSVTSEQVQAVARKYFTDDTLTVAVLEPQPIKQSQHAGAATAGGRHGR